MITALVLLVVILLLFFSVEDVFVWVAMALLLVVTLASQ